MGSKAVLIAIPKTPKGSWFTLSAKYKYEIEPSGKVEASIISIRRLI